uniref:Uncharacterized protein n=1 Tax=Panagrolaimus sp. ES5 TaxID=591445 RepID=A0AC34FHE8_9BILA
MAYDYANRGGHTGGQNRMPREAAARERYVGDRDEVYEVQVSRNLQQQPQYRNDPVLNDAERGRGAAREPRGAGGARNDTFHREPHMNQAERQPTAQDFRGGRQQVEGRERFAGDRRQDFGYERNENFQRADPSMREYVAQQVLPEIRGQQPQTDREYEVHRGQQQQQQQDQRGRQQQQDIPRRNVNQQAEAIYEELPLHEREQNYDYPPSDNHHQQPRRQERERPQASGSEIDPHIRITSRDNAARALVNYGNEQIPAYAISPASNQNPPLNHERMIYRDDPDYDYPPGGAPARHGQQMHNQVIPQREPQRNIGARVQQPRVEPYAVETEYDIPVQEVRNPPMDPYQNSPRAERVDRGRRAESPIRVQQQNYQQNRQPSLNQAGGQNRMPREAAARERYVGDRDEVYEVQVSRNLQQRAPYRNEPAVNDAERGRGAARKPRGAGGARNDTFHREPHMNQAEREREPTAQDFRGGRHQVEGRERFAGDRGQDFGYERNENFQRADPSMREYVAQQVLPERRDQRGRQQQQDITRRNVHQQAEAIYEELPLHEHEQNYDYPPSDNQRQQPRRHERERPQASGSGIDPHIRITSRDNAARALVNYGNEQNPAYAISPASNQNPPLNHERVIYRDDPDYDYPPGGAPARHGQQMHDQVIPQRRPQRNIGARVQQPSVEPYAAETEYDIPVQEVRNPPMDPYQNSPRAERVDRGRRAESPIRVQQQNYQQNRQPLLNQGRFGPPLLSQQEQYDLDQQRLQQHPQQQQQRQRQPRQPAAHQQPPRQIYDEIPRREEPVQQPLQQRARQQAPAYQQTENVYDEILIRDNRADREESDHQRGRRHVEGIYENPSLHEHEHNYDYPPSDGHHQRHPDEQPPPAQNNRYPRSCTIISMRPRCGSALDESQGNHVARDPEQRIDENVEVVREALLPEPVQQNARRHHENVEVITEENSQALLPEPGQWNIRRIVPRQNRNQRNNNDEDFNYDENVIDNSQNHHRDETLNEDVDGWDTPPPQQQGAGGHDNHAAPGQQRQPSNEGNESGFFDGDGFGEPSYRPRHSGDGGQGGFARPNFNNYDSGRGENGGPNGYNGYQYQQNC